MDDTQGIKTYYSITEQLFAQLSHEQIWGPEGIQPLKRFKEGETAYVASCPGAKVVRQSFLMPKTLPGGACKMTGYRSNWLTAAVQKAGKSFRDGVALLAEKAEIDPSSFGLSDADWSALETTWKKLHIMGLLSSYFSKAFQRSQHPAIAAAKTYFKGLGLTERVLISFPVGAYTTRNEIRGYLSKSGISDDMIGSAGLFDERLEKEHPFLYEYGDSQGNIVGYAGCDPSDPSSRVLMPGFSPGLQAHAFFGLEQAISMITSERSVWLASREEDTISIQYESNRTFKVFKQMVSFGYGLMPTPEKLIALSKLGAQRYIFASAVDKAGLEQTSRFSTAICGLGVRADIMPLPEDEHSLAELIQDRGFDYFDKAIISKSGLYSVGRWLGREVEAKFDLTKESDLLKAKKDAARKSLELSEQDSREFVTAIGDRLKWDPHFWCIVIEELRKEAVEEPVDKQVEKLFSQMETKRQDDMEMGFSWSVSADDLEEVAVVTVSEDELMRSFYNPRELLENYETARPGLSTGLATLDKYIAFRPGEMTLVSGLPGSGKTTFCINVISQVLSKSDGDAVLFFTFENTRLSVFNMLISNLYQIPHGDILGKKLEAGGSVYQKYLNAIEDFTRYRDRLVVIEEPIHTRYAASDVQEICQMMSDNVKIGVVVIDSLGMLSLDKTSPIESETELATTVKDLVQTACRTNTPFLSTKTPWMAHVRAPGGDLAEPPLSISPRVEPFVSTILGLRFRHSSDPESAGKEHRTDTIAVNVQKNSMGPMPHMSLEIGFDVKYRRLVDLV